MSVLKTKQKYSYADYLAWGEDERAEILDGIPYMSATPSRLHQEVSGELFAQFYNYLSGKECRVYHAPFCVRLDNAEDAADIKNVVEPDISIVCDKSKLDEKGCKGSPEMIIEIISPTSIKKDRIIKFNKYEKAGVKVYWVVEPNEKMVSVFILQPNGRYGRPEMYTDEDKITVEMFPDLVIDLKSVFDED